MDPFAPLILRRAYWDDPIARIAFQDFLRAIHGLDLGPWERAGFWDDDYRPFSLFDGERVVSSVCLYSMDMTVDGRRMRLGQISGVGTLPEYRRRGLNRRLTRLALEWAAPTHAGFFLFADDEAVEFYRNTGFRPMEEQTTQVAVVAPRPRGGGVALDMDRADDRERIFALARARSPVSDRLGVRNEKLLLFHCLYSLRRHLHYIAPLDLVVAARHDAGRLLLYDVIGREVPPFAEIHPYLTDGTEREVWFHFVPDKMGLSGGELRPLTGNNTHVLPGFPVADGGLVFPYTAHA
jgi:ribosomal protein S18 acetylase RimI-like enzyme